jgi:hypothetical protein
MFLEKEIGNFQFSVVFLKINSKLGKKTMRKKIHDVMIKRRIG